MVSSLIPALVQRLSTPVNHYCGKLFPATALGEQVSPQFATLVEDASPNALGVQLAGLPEVKEVIAAASPTNTLIDPGKSWTMTVETTTIFSQLTLVSSLIPTNDAFIAVNGIAGPAGDNVVSLFVPAYDAGSERNDELCASLFGPSITECGGAGGGGHPGGGEGFVHIHNGIHGVGNLTPALRDWRNPVARILIRRVGGAGQVAAGVDL
ncbi:MAG: hypothetical protein FJ147_15200 [Deltaproteobacteria bacterium]|nr:hypothetical protein [Deltaproteobacteria bacterium]